MYEDFERRFESRQFCRRTTTLGGATTTRGGDTHFKSPFYFPLFIFYIYLYLFLFYFNIDFISFIILFFFSFIFISLIFFYFVILLLFFCLYFVCSHVRSSSPQLFEFKQRSQLAVIIPAIPLSPLFHSAAHFNPVHHSTIV